MLKIYYLFKEALTYIEPDPIAVKEAGVDRERYLRWHRRYVNIARFFGFFAGITAIALLIAIPFISNLQELNPAKLVFIFVATPFLAFLWGCIYGATLACLIAPSDFMLGPLGRKWMGFVGTDNIYVAKIICVIVFLGMTIVGAGLTGAMVRGILTEQPAEVEQKG